MFFFSSLSAVSSPKSCVIGAGLVPGAGLVHERQAGGEEEEEELEEAVVTVTPLANQRIFSTLPSVDSAVESWDGSNVDGNFSTNGRQGALSPAAVTWPSAVIDCFLCVSACVYVCVCMHSAISVRSVQLP